LKQWKIINVKTSTIEDTILIILWTPEESSELKIRKYLIAKVQKEFISLLRELIDAFA